MDWKGLFVPVVYEYNDYFEPVLISLDYICRPDIGLPTLISKITGAEYPGLPEDKLLNVIINPEREKYRAHLNEMSIKEYGRPYRFPDEEEDEEDFADGDE